jgi:hypothetical protein
MAAPDYLKDFVTDFAQQAKTSFAVPLDPSTFMGRQFVEGLDPLQTQAIGLAQQGVGSFQPFLTSAQQAITQAGQDVAGLRQFAGAGAGTGAGSIAAFQSPFQQQVIDETLRQFDMERARGRRGIQDAAVAVGGFGGGREGVQLAEFDSDTLANRAGIRAGLLQQGFQDAAARRQQAFANQQALAAAQAGFRCIKTKPKSSIVKSRSTISTSKCNGAIRKIRKIWYSINWIIRWSWSTSYATTTITKSCCYSII